jgi:hypothetical protein
MSMHAELNHLEQLLEYIVTHVEQATIKSVIDGEEPTFDKTKFPDYVDKAKRLLEHTERASKGLARIQRQIRAESNLGRKYMQSRGQGYKTTVKDANKRSAALAARCYKISKRILDTWHNTSKQWELQPDELGTAVAKPFQDGLKAFASIDTPTGKASTEFVPAPPVLTVKPDGITLDQALIFMEVALAVVADAAVRYFKARSEKKSSSQGALSTKTQSSKAHRPP